MLMKGMIETRKILYQVFSELKIFFQVTPIDGLVLRNFVEQFHSDGQQNFIRDFFSHISGSCDAPDGPGAMGYCG